MGKKLTSLEEVRLRCGGHGDCSSSMEHLASVLDFFKLDVAFVEISGLDTTDGVTMDALMRCLPRLKKIRRLALRYNSDHLVGPAFS